jgi:dephospho-CoA kinase
MLIVGLTGGIASGKTAVSKILREEGAYIIDADQIARELVQPDTPTWRELIRVFGKEILDKDGSIHRKKLAAIIFSDPEQRNLLNQIIQPRIKEEIDLRVKRIGQKDPEAIVVIDAALLVERGEHGEMDKLVVVTSTERQQIERLKEREGASEEEARKILASQMVLREKLKVADFVIQNEGCLEEMQRMAKEVFQELKRIALQKANDKHPNVLGRSSE